MMNKPRVLCYFNHYYNPNGTFKGKSTDSDSSNRKAVIQQALDTLKQLDNCTVKVCGIEGYSLVPVDVPFNQLQDSRMLVYSTLLEMADHLDEYDYFINIEDDILVTNTVLENIYEFDQVSTLNEVLLPNRLEKENGEYYCVDTKKCFPGWINTERVFKNRLIKVAINPHSGILILSRDKYRYAMSQISAIPFKKMFGGIMASSYAHFHKPFCLYRVKDDITFHSVIHLDSWKPRKGKFFNRLKIESIKRYIRIIPLRCRFHIEDLT